MIFVDYEPVNIYAPVASHDSVLVLTALSLAKISFLEGADFINAYPYVDLHILSSWNMRSQGMFAKLLNSLYGTLQAEEI